ncbi:MAG: C40 family peptidase [Oscillospiraceae bacterium]|nr:C40 family peptidase [Oscillospiraceae bacterium]
MKRLTRTICTVLATITFVSTLTFGVSAKSGAITTHIGQVDASALRLRSKPSTSSTTLSIASRGDYVVITGKTGSWYYVEFDLTEGYMHESYLDTYTAKNVELGYGSVTGNKVNVRSGPSTSYSPVTRVDAGDKAYIIGFNDQWYKVIVNEKIGYIRSDYLDLTEIPYENAASTKEPLFFVDGKSTGVTPSAAALKGGSTTSATRQHIVSNAKKLLGTPYVWGGTTPKGFDCSGFVQYVLDQSGITIPRTTAEQVKVGKLITKSDLLPGDLVFLKDTYRTGVSHVGIYIGDGKMIHASSSKGVTTSDLSSSYYQKHYHSARRVL